MKIRNLFRILLAMSLLYSANRAWCVPDMIQGVAEAEYKASSRESPYHAQLEAKKLALRGFIEKVIGVHISSWFTQFVSEEEESIRAKAYDLVDVWSSAYVRIDSVYENVYDDYIVHYKALVSTPASEVENFLKDIKDIQLAARETRKQELIEHTKHRYAVTAEVEDMVLIPAEKGEPPLYIDRYPVSVLQYRRFDQSYSSDFFYLEPATGISGDRACDYCSSKGKRLPTDIEWERAREKAASWGIEYIVGEYVAKHGQKLALLDTQIYVRTDPTRVFNSRDLIYNKREGRGWRSFDRRYAYEWIRLPAPVVMNRPPKGRKYPVKLFRDIWGKVSKPKTKGQTKGLAIKLFLEPYVNHRISSRERFQVGREVGFRCVRDVYSGH